MTTHPTPDTPASRSGGSLDATGFAGSSMTPGFLFTRQPPSALQAPPVNDAVGTQPTKSRHLAFEVYGTILVLGGLLAGSSALSQASRGAIKTVSSQFLFSLITGLPVIALFAVLERIAPAGPHKSVKGWFLNLRIVMLFSFAGTLAGVLGGCLAAALEHRFGLGWIDLRFATGRGIIALVTAFLLSIFIADFFYYW